MNYTLTFVLCRLFEFPGFKIENYTVHAGGYKWDISSLPIEEGLITAYLELSARIKAEELVKSAKVVL